MPDIIRRLIRNDIGQDLVEYGLLAAIIGIAGIAFLPAIQDRIGVVFSDWGTAVYNAWIPNDPAP
ncbi:MAG: hypothetical protein A3F70_09945 [Acidobacteria bacterium RIFCSPLOWO2_12_FULL_67_14]|nr:MAG: hypothetical protein A3H29_00155 [Acidobacteria bacterium RIFCSPLOWO2_02_FULL_67_21]OFW38073.1 MAG: hypothetical protein A3F70_09945 [Acidobacteria bacterium RIFCSPLOWO2_12_FULL_67_14]